MSALIDHRRDHEHLPEVLANRRSTEDVNGHAAVSGRELRSVNRRLDALEPSFANAESAADRRLSGSDCDNTLVQVEGSSCRTFGTQSEARRDEGFNSATCAGGSVNEHTVLEGTIDVFVAVEGEGFTFKGPVFIPHLSAPVVASTSTVADVAGESIPGDGGLAL